MKILFVNPPSKNNKQFVRLIDCSHEAKASYLWQPNDFMIISSYLKDSDEAFLLDGTCDEMNDDFFFQKIDDYKKFVEIDKNQIRPSEVPYLKGDYSKAREAMGWMPEISFGDLVSIMVQYDIARTTNDTQSTYSVK